MENLKKMILKAVSEVSDRKVYKNIKISHSLKPMGNKIS